MDKTHVIERIDEIGIIPGIRTASAADALFGAETVAESGIPIAEITTTIPGYLDVIRQLREKKPDMIIGAGTVLDHSTAEACLAAGVDFLTSPSLDLEIIKMGNSKNTLVIAGALTPTEIVTAWKASCGLVKVFPCAQVGGDSYIRALRGPFPSIKLVAAGGVNQQTAADFILAGSTALGIGAELVPPTAMHLRQVHRIHELSRRFLTIVRNARAQMQPRDIRTAGKR